MCMRLLTATCAVHFLIFSLCDGANPSALPLHVLVGINPILKSLRCSFPHVLLTEYFHLLYDIDSLIPLGTSVFLFISSGNFFCLFLGVRCFLTCPLHPDDRNHLMMSLKMYWILRFVFFLFFSCTHGHF